MNTNTSKIFGALQRWPLKRKIIIGVTTVLLLGYGLIFGIPKPVTFGYSASDCTRQLTLFPGVMRQASQSSFKVKFSEVVMLAGVPVLSLKACFEPTGPPAVGHHSVTVGPLGGWVFAKRFNVEVGEAPTAMVADFIGKTLPVTRPVTIGLNKPDDVFTYKLRVGDEMADCHHSDATLACDIEPLALNQGEEYQAGLQRYFENTKIEELGSGEIKTLRALVLANASVSEGQTVYDKPANFQFEYDKSLSTAEAKLQRKEGETLEAVPIEVTVEDKTVLISPDNELKRATDFVLTIEKVEAEDGSALPDQQMINFTMSGGPKVTGVNIGRTGVATGGTVIVTLDQPIANSDKVGELVSVSGLSATIKVDGARILIPYSANLCKDFSVSIKQGFESEAGVVQTEDWSFAGRTICYYVQTIGSSRSGRAINAYVFGGGNKTVLFTGSIHGDEHSARLLMNAWINELDANARSIPAGTRVVVIPSLNPDGTAANSRYNAANVDLNRNYATSDWKRDIQTPYGQPHPGGGGSNPGSEPETQALMNYSLALSPRLTMSFHAVAGYAIGNGCGDSAGLAATYAKMTGYANMTGNSGAFAYEITGTYDDWLCEKYGLTSVLIELGTKTGNEFTRNKAALWAMVKA